MAFQVRKPFSAILANHAMLNFLKIYWTEQHLTGNVLRSCGFQKVCFVQHLEVYYHFYHLSLFTYLNSYHAFGEMLRQIKLLYTLSNWPNFLHIFCWCLGSYTPTASAPGAPRLIFVHFFITSWLSTCMCLYCGCKIKS